MSAPHKTNAVPVAQPHLIQFNLGDAARFLKSLDPTAQAFTFQTFDDSKDRVRQRREALAADIAQLSKKRSGDALASAVAAAKRSHRDPFARIIEGSLNDVAAKLQDLNNEGAGIYVTVNETKLNGSRKQESVERVRAVFADLDGAPLEPVLACALQPHIVIETSPGRYQAF